MKMAAAVVDISEVSNGAAPVIQGNYPYIAHFQIEGTANLLLHAWNVDAVAEKASAKKGSDGKKTDNLESYVRRNDEGLICMPVEYIRMSIVTAAKFRQDPRSPRKSGMDLFKAGIVSLEELSPIIAADGHPTTKWEIEDRRRVQVQRAGITRVRPAFKAGWSVAASLMVSIPEYIQPKDLNETLASAGRLIGVGDFRPTFGRFNVTRFEVMTSD